MSHKFFDKETNPQFEPCTLPYENRNRTQVSFKAVAVQCFYLSTGLQLKAFVISEQQTKKHQSVMMVGLRNSLEENQFSIKLF